MKSFQVNDTILKIEKVQLQKEMGIVKANINMSTVEVLSSELEEARSVYNYLMKNSLYMDTQVSN